MKLWFTFLAVNHLAEACGLPSKGFFLFSLYINVSIFYFGKSYPVMHRFSVDNSVSANYHSMIAVHTSTVCKRQTSPESAADITLLMLCLYPYQYFILTRLTLCSQSPVILFHGAFFLSFFVGFVSNKYVATPQPYATL